MALIATTGMMGGCVPLPNMHYFAPAIDGVVTEDGAPVAGAQITVRTQFASDTSAAITTQYGRFRTEAIRELRLTAVLIGDPLFGYTVEIRHRGETYVGFANFDVGQSPPSIQLNCDLSHPVSNFNRTTYCAARDSRTSS